MENSHHAPLTLDDARSKILLRAREDWVSLGEARYLVGLTSSGGPPELRELTLSAIESLVSDGLVELGDLQPQFERWGVDDATALRRVRDGWAVPGVELRPGDVCWLATTPAGDDLAEQLRQRT